MVDLQDKLFIRKQNYDKSKQHKIKKIISNMKECKDDIYIDYINELLKQYKYLNGFVEEYELPTNKRVTNGVDFEKSIVYVDKKTYELRDLGFDKGLLNISYEDYDLDRQNELLVILIDKEFNVPNNVYPPYRYFVSFYIVDKIKNDIIVSNVVKQYIENFPILNIQFAIRDFNSKKYIYYYNKSEWNYQLDNYINQVESFNYDGKKIAKESFYYQDEQGANIDEEEYVALQKFSNVEYSLYTVFENNNLFDNYDFKKIIIFDRNAKESDEEEYVMQITD